MLLALVASVSLALFVPAEASLDNAVKPHIIRNEINADNLPNSYDFVYETSDGTSRKEQGVIMNHGTDEAHLKVDGTVRWYDDRGDLYEMTYKAGKRGYRTVIKRVRQ